VANTGRDAADIAASINSVDGVTATATNSQTAIAFTDVVGTEFVAANQNDSVASGAFTDPGLAAGQTYSLTVGGVEIFSQTGVGAITGADIDAAFNGGTVQADLAAAGISYSGTDFATGDMVFSRADGASFDIVVVNDAAANGFAGADFATGTNTVNNGSLEVP